MYSIDYIYKALYLYFKENKSFNKIGKMLNVSRQIISIWINKFNKDILFLSNRHKKRNIKINTNIHNIDIQLFIKKIIYTNPFVTRKELIEHVFLYFNIKLTLNNISKIYKKLNMTRKKPKYHIVKTIDFMNKLIEKRKLFLEEINKEDINKIISIDESGFNKLLSNSKGLSEKGAKINVPIKQKLDKNISLLLATTTAGILHFNINKDNTNSILFCKFIKEIIDKLQEKNYIFVFDNICFHHNKIMLNLITSNGHKYMFTPPYSPNNNPVESIFSIIKKKYNKINYANKNKVEKKIFNVIQEVIVEYTNFNSIFKRSLTFNYVNIEKELKDRIIFIS
jgi:transposase